MAIINNDSLREVYNHLCSLEIIVKKEIDQVSRNKSHIDKIVPENLISQYSKKYNTAQTFADNIVKASYELSIVKLVAEFERIAFAKYQTSYGEIKSLVNSQTEDSIDYFNSRERFINGKIDKLHEIINLIDGHAPEEYLDQLRVVKNYRDYLAHGKRFGQEPDTYPTLKFVAETLDRILTEIEK